AHRGGRDPLRDDALLPQPGAGPDVEHLVGHDPRVRVRGGSRFLEQLVVDRPPGTRCGARRARVHDDRLRAGRDPESQAQGAMSLLSVEDLYVTYKTQAGAVPAVRGISLRLSRGEVLGLAGESGCGKSTIAGAILRLLPKGTEV